MAFAELSTGVRLFHTDEGAGGPPLLLVHGVGGDSSDWVFQLPAFSARHRTIAPDLRGHGGSSVPAAGYGPGDYADDLVELLARLETGPVVAVGHSLGAVVVSNLARERPELLAGAVLLDPTYGDPPERDAEVKALLCGFHERGDVAGAVAALGSREGAETPAWMVEWHRRRGLATPAHVMTGTLVGLHDGEQAMNRGEVEPTLRARTVPLLVYHALPGLAAWERTLQDDPRSEVHDVSARSGHWLHHDLADEVTERVLAWVAGLTR